MTFSILSRVVWLESMSCLVWLMASICWLILDWMLESI